MVLARRYDSCFLKWYSESKPKRCLFFRRVAAHAGSEYLRGDSTTDECEGLFKQYKDCLTVSIRRPETVSSNTNLLQKALKERGIDTMLEEAKEGNKDTDAENMRRTCKSAVSIRSTPNQLLIRVRMSSDEQRLSTLSCTFSFPRTLYTDWR